MKKIVIVLLHFLTSIVIYDAIVVFSFFFYDYVVSDLIRSLLIGCAIIACDYAFSRMIIQKNDLAIKSPKLLHGADLILAIAPGAFAVSGTLGDIPLWLRRPADPSTRYGIVFLIITIIIEALLITDRIFLIKLTTGRSKP